MLVRPEAVVVGADANGDGDERAAGASAATATVVGRAFYGPDQLVWLELASGRRVRSRLPGFAAWSPGDRVKVWVEGPVQVLAPEPR